MYAKLIDTKHIEYCPQELLIEAKRVIGFTESFLNDHGFYKLVQEPCEIDSDKAVIYEMKDNHIIQKWR